MCHTHLHQESMHSGRHSHSSAAHHCTSVASSVAPKVIVRYFITLLILSSNPYICVLHGVTIVTFLKKVCGCGRVSGCWHGIKGDEANKDDYQGNQVQC